MISDNLIESIEAHEGFSSTVYKATFTPSGDGSKTITVSENTFVDTSAGNANDESTS